MGYGDWTGFYDWLRQRKGGVIGVRFTPAIEEVEFLPKELGGLNYVSVTPARTSIEIFFTTARDFDAHLSCDQDFGENKVFASHDRQYAISFGTAKLSWGELKVIRGL
jgi:hypothetical protein